MPLLATLARLAYLLSGAPAPSASTPHEQGTVVFGGDVIPHASVLASFERNGSLLGPVAPTFRAADVALVNLESAASPTHAVPRAGMRYNVHADFVRALRDAGIDGVSVANNHAYDQGPRAVGDTVATLRAAGLRAMGGALAGEDPLATSDFALAGATLCVVAATRIHNYYWVVPHDGVDAARIAAAEPFLPAHERALLDAVHRAHERCGAVIVSLHSGVEYERGPLARDRAFFRRVADAGADAVIGHHSHTPQPVELYTAGARRVPIFYSLGNLVSAQGWGVDATTDRARLPVFATDARLREGLLAVLRFERAEPGHLRLAEFGFVPVWTVNTDTLHRAASGTRVEAALLPADGAGAASLRARYESVVMHAGTAFLLPEASLPGAEASLRASRHALEP